MTTLGNEETGIGRRRLLKALAAMGISRPLLVNLAAKSRMKISVAALESASAIRGEEFSAERLKVIDVALQRNLDQFQIVRDFEVDDLIEPAPMFVTKRYASAATADPSSAVDGTGDRGNEVGHG